MNNKMSVLFISHGAPDLVLSESPAVEALRLYAAQTPRPHAIIIVSAHWAANPVGITAGLELHTIHDFGGFPDTLYAMQYPARGDAVLSDRIRNRLMQHGIECKLHYQRGLDHGAWIPLKIMYPEADIPVIQVSLPRGALHETVKLGKALSTFRQDNILLIGSGGSVHNLHALNNDGKTDDWVLQFEDWLLNAVEGNHFARLISTEAFPDNFRKAHPSIEHYAPLVFAWAAADTERAGKRIHHSFCYGNLGMSIFEFE
jgi:4,5-DOPA dioxygenase extradiol